MLANHCVQNVVAKEQVPFATMTPVAKVLHNFVCGDLLKLMNIG